MFDPSNQPPRERRSWLASLSPNHQGDLGQQLGYGCLVIVIAGTLVLYCAGTISLVARPLLLQRSTPTELVRPTLVPTPTQAPTTFINLPPGTLLATPTQGPIPTREPPTVTPTVDLTNPAPTASVTPRGSPSSGGTRPARSATPTRKPSATVTPR